LNRRWRRWWWLWPCGRKGGRSGGPFVSGRPGVPFADERLGFVDAWKAQALVINKGTWLPPDPWLGCLFIWDRSQ
jgi:hypothetical protein